MVSKDSVREALVEEESRWLEGSKVLLDFEAALRSCWRRRISSNSAGRWSVGIGEVCAKGGYHQP